ncbi:MULTISPECIES: thiamine-phosphate kinase [Aphanothece]|uniref:thiamine-phosphate kinase n=1 Tax=Aphanothece TaxID=1121 RepID=UPI0039849C48
MGSAEEPTLAELGEAGLIDQLARFAPPGQYEDDAARLRLEGDLVVNTDLLVEGVHFSAATTEPFHVGWRAAAANLSDLAAMGCLGALGLTVGLVAPAQTPWPWVRELYQGLRSCLDAHGGGEVLGGDCSSGQHRIVSITALGLLPPSAPGEAPGSGAPVIRRCDGRPGDVLVCTGSHGLSRLGLALLQRSLPPGPCQLLGDGLVARALRAHQLPVPRFDAVRALHATRPAASSWRVGGTDSSDGLVAAAAAVARASGCHARLDRAALPIEPGLAQLAEGERWCLAGGEDFELVLALESPWAAALVAALDGSHVIGRLASGEGPPGAITWLDGASLPSGTGGFHHFEATRGRGGPA